VELLQLVVKLTTVVGDALCNRVTLGSLAK